MQIEIDFDVFKQLTSLRKTENDSYNNVIRRLLGLPDAFERIVAALAEQMSHSERSGPSDQGRIFGLGGNWGAWFNGIFFPEGTQFRATYKGSTYTAKIEEARWVDQNGVSRNSPSDAASAVCKGTNVNGWRFWHALRPGDTDWHRLDELR